ncbi:peroxiredoxin [Paracoccus seriniphilus]|uniref:Glutathione-dependent peroxiredoxin n=1 Tax=Paracoccus seriniphilus TaxID=184748 RepID=A0A239PRY1_9RHOB|nr:peroxiredoxin [Paracoccus seriniphilus]WCR14388.1 peroxiredoxin [Paracoccus seriniphilus]SNT72898.1 thiol peroxidase (atypical 2-Cys peroxiredoxin) [Paracoccus seriniphilus]
MTIQVGDTFPGGTLLRVGENGPEAVDTAELGKGRTVIFGLPGAYTGTCTNAHMPSFIRTAQQFRDKGISRIVCLTVNDPFVCDAWAKSTGAPEAGIEVLADADGSVTKALGLDFDAPPAGLFGRCQRFAALLRDGKVEVIDVEDSPGTCSVSAGEALLEKA